MPFAHLHLQISDTDNWLLTPRLSFDWRTWLKVGCLPSFLLARHSLHSRVLLPAAAINKRPIYLGQFRWLTHPNYFASGMFILDRFTLGFFLFLFLFMLKSILLRERGKKKRKKRKCLRAASLSTSPLWATLNMCKIWALLKCYFHQRGGIFTGVLWSEVAATIAEENCFRKCCPSLCFPRIPPSVASLTREPSRMWLPFPYEVVRAHFLQLSRQRLSVRGN